MILGHSSVKTTKIYLDFLTPEEALIAKAAGTKAGTVVAVRGVYEGEKSLKTNSMPA